MNNLDNRISHLTPESVERLEIVNKIFDILKRNSQLLKELKIIKVLVFGSAVKGLSKVTSDLDIVFLKKRDPNLSFPELSKNTDSFMNEVEQIFKDLPIPVSFFPVKKGPLSKVIHVNLDYVSSPDLVPDYAQDSILIWENTAAPIPQAPKYLQKVRSFFGKK